MKTIYIDIDEWFPVVDIHDHGKDEGGYSTGRPITVSDDLAEFVLEAYKNFRCAQTMMKEEIKRQAKRGLIK